MPGFRSEGTDEVISDREKRWRLYLGGIALGQAESLALLYGESAASLLGLALRMMRNKADAEEIMLDVFEQVWRTAKSFDPTRGSVWRWLVVLVRSRAVDRLRTAAAKRDRERVSIAENWDLVSHEPLPDSTTIFNQERVLIHSAIRLLPGEQRQALELAYFSGLTHVEIASELGVPLGTIKTRIRAAMDKLRVSLARGGLATVVWQRRLGQPHE
jgi:RNA polymerase sigma-70 factor (ECF subfamily)